MKTRSRAVRCAQSMLVSALIAVALLGCSAGGGTTEGEGSDRRSLKAPQIKVSTTTIDFGGVVLENASDRSITVENSGTAALKIESISPLPAPFAFAEDSCSGATLSPSGTCSIKARFSPVNQGNHSVSFNIASNDRDKGQVAVSLRGSGMGLSVSINRIDKENCPARKLKLGVSVTDKAGTPVVGLQEGNFSLWENGQPIVPFVFSAALVYTPISVGLVLDNSGSMVPFTANLEAAAISFLDQLQFPLDEAEVIKFTKVVSLSQEFTADKSLLVAAVSRAFPGERSGTSLYDAVWRSIDNTAARTNSRKAVIAVSDGADWDSTSTLDGLIAHAVEKGVSIFAIGIGTVNAEQMQRLARETGGLYYLAPTSSDLQAVYLKISEALSNQYLIEYTTSSSGGNTVSLDVEVDDNGSIGADSRDPTGC